MANPLSTIQSTVSSKIPADLRARIQTQLDNLPKIDFSQISLPKLPKVSLPSVSIPSIHSLDLTKVDLSNVKSAVKFDEIVESAPVRAVRDAGYTVVGFGVLAFQKAQVRRREITEALKSRMNTAQ